MLRTKLRIKLIPATLFILFVMPSGTTASRLVESSFSPPLRVPESEAIAKGTRDKATQPEEAGSCNCYYSSDCSSGDACSYGGTCTPSGKKDGTCKGNAELETQKSTNHSSLLVARAVDLYFEAYLSAIRKGGGHPDPTLINMAQNVPLSSKTHEIIQQGTWITLDALMGWDFMYPPEYLRSRGYWGNIREVHGVEDAFKLVDITRRAYINAIETQNTGAIVEPLTNFWNETTDYRPRHTGRRYPHGHEEVTTTKDILNCQIDTLNRVLQGLLGQAR